MNALAPLPGAKLALLIPRLGSDHDGEVLATARAIRRVLEADGRDLHDLAAAVAAAAPKPDYRVGLLEELIASGLLTEWEIGFVSSIRAQILQRPHFRPSPKQFDVLERLFRKVGRTW